MLALGIKLIVSENQIVGTKFVLGCVYAHSRHGYAIIWVVPADIHQLLNSEKLSFSVFDKEHCSTWYSLLLREPASTYVHAVPARTPVWVWV